jgi:TonB family protein
MKIQNLLRVTFFLLLLGAGLTLSNAVQAQVPQTIKIPAEEMPVPPGGITGLTNYMIQNLKYPTAAKEANVQGMVMVSFIVTEEGKVEAVEVVRGIGSGCDEEAARVVAESGIWIPGKKEGRPVAVKMTLPVQFKL